MDKKAIAFIVICSLVMFTVGFYTGVSVTLNKVADMASRFIDIDKSLIEQAIFQYENNIGKCYPSKQNALIYNNPGN